MNHLMIDIETLGTEPDAAILSIGAVFFDVRIHALGGLYTVIKKDCPDNMCRMHDKATLDWWEKQSPEARQVFVDAESDKAISLGQALQTLNLFIGKKKPKVWSNGATFDLMILENAYRQMKIKTPWSFRDHRCYRTLKSLQPNLKAKRIGTYHNAEDDACYQAICASKILGDIEGDTL